MPPPKPPKQREASAEAVVNALRKRPDLLVAVRQALGAMLVIGPWTEEPLDHDNTRTQLVRRTVPSHVDTAPALVASVYQKDNGTWVWKTFIAGGGGENLVLHRYEAIDAAEDQLRAALADALFLAPSGPQPPGGVPGARV
jgi:hypothetical protein